MRLGLAAAAAAALSTTSLVARRSAPRMLSSSHSSAESLQRTLDSVHLDAPPRIQLTDAAAERAAAHLGSVVVLDSSFNPPTRAHVAMVGSVAAAFGAPRALLLLSKQNADKPVSGATLVQRLQMMELLELPVPATVGATAHPLFADKPAALRALCGPEARIHLLVGYAACRRISSLLGP
jgi:hypothetical protein